MMILQSVRMFMTVAAVVFSVLCPHAQQAAAAQVAVTASIDPSISATPFGDALLVRANAPWVLQIACGDPDCTLPHVYTRPNEHGQVIVHLHGEGYSICLQ